MTGPAEHLPTAPKPHSSRDLTAQDIARQLAELGPDEE